MNKVYVPAIGNRNAELMLLGEAPSYVETQSGKPFQGPAGRELDHLLRDSGINRGDLWISNVFKYEILPNIKGKKIPAWIRAHSIGINIEESLNELQTEINSIKPNCILALGGTALWALTGIKPKSKQKKSDLESLVRIPTGGISDYRGSIMMGMGRKIVPTYHPAHLLYSDASEVKGYWNRMVMILDFKRAFNQSKFPELKLPQRVLQVCKSSYELSEFYNRYRNLTKVSVDIEARGHCLPVCIGLAFNKSHGMTVPLWNRDGISSIPDVDLVSIWIILAEILYEKEIIGQNFNYDRDKIRRLGFTIRHHVSDTMLKAFAINPELPKGLAFNTSIYTEEPFYKNDGMYEGSIEDLLLGCARDACVTYEVDESMQIDLEELNQTTFYEQFLMKLPELYLSIENQGFRINEEERDRLLQKYIEWDERLRYELFKLIGTEINVNSPKQVWTLLFDNLKLPQRNGTGEEELTSLLNLQSFTDPNKRRIVELILEDRRVRRSISNNIMVLPDYDGRVRTTYFLCLETGRTSTSQQDPPIRPEIEIIDENNKKKKRALGTPFQTMTKHGDVGAEVRAMYIPDEI